MSENYYSREDQPNLDDPQVALDLWNQSAAALAAYPAQAQQAIQEIEATLAPWFEAAVANNDTALQGELVLVHGNAQKLVDRVLHLDALTAGAAATMKTLEEQRVQAVQELEALNEAIEIAVETGEVFHDKIQELAASLEDHMFENGLHMQCPGCHVHEQDYEGLWSDLDHDYINNFCYALFSADSENLTLELRTELIDFINQFGKKMDAVVYGSPVDLDAAPEE